MQEESDPDLEPYGSPESSDLDLESLDQSIDGEDPMAAEYCDARHLLDSWGLSSLPPPLLSSSASTPGLPRQSLEGKCSPISTQMTQPIPSLEQASPSVPDLHQ